MADGWYATFDLVGAVAGELEVVPLHVDRPGLVAEDVDPVLDAGQAAELVRVANEVPA